ncbi:NAD(P)/FAD-dependent oxidoreductase [Agitococcus lubricus]|uniref:Rubredoxin-NAD+ reductase n=1 Tax=Agitococcus lubricus TaxID=1077255 RepID=A0A2T5J3G8_9GAMM|nr:FAD-dependent oxidoreductase [Agitococcus lubricus]PTQ91043.1 rubredoxin-NAD+ reductase [Agitococcus lubricus]
MALVIIGTGLAGYNLAREWRKLNPEKALILISQDDGRNYSKPMLSTGYTKGKTADQLAMQSAAQMSEQLKAEIRTFATVEAIDTQAKTVTVDGVSIAYEQLVLALGADPFQPPLAGDGLDRVYTVNDLMDYAKFQQAAAGKKQVIVIGGGLIGCEYANDLSNGGYSVQLIEPVGRVLPALLPPVASQAVGNALAGLGVTFHFGVSVQAVYKNGEGVRAVLSDGREIEGDIVLSAIGLRPRISLAKAAGLAVNRGIVVDKTLATSQPDIYALGDCAEVEGLVLPYVLPLMAGARALAKTLSGQTSAISYPVMPVQVKTPVCAVVVAPAFPNMQGEWTVDSQEGNNVKALFKGADGQLLAYALTGAFAGDAALKAELAKQVPAWLS